MPLTLEGIETPLRQLGSVEAKTSVESFVPSLQWSPSRFVTRCHQEKIPELLHLSLFWCQKKQDKICAVHPDVQSDKWCAPFICAALVWFPSINCTTPVLFSACNDCELWGINQAQNQGQTKSPGSLGGCWTTSDVEKYYPHSQHLQTIDKRFQLTLGWDAWPYPSYDSGSW